MGLKDRLVHGWNAFWGRAPTLPDNYGYVENYRTSSLVLTRGNEKDTINAVLNRIAVDAASISLEHARLDDEKRYKEPMKTQLNECLTMAANMDQTSRMFMQDAVMTLLTVGVIAIVPTQCTEDPRFNGSYDIGSLRVGNVTKWFPGHVQVSLYNEMTGKRDEIIFPKNMVALPENPFYEIMNKPNSTYRRLLAKLRQLDAIDSESASGKLDLLIQVPYTTRNQVHKEMAETRRQAIEDQLTGSKYGVAYIDGTEKVIQLNRAVENQLFNQIEYYTKMLFSQLGLPPSVFDGTADEATMLNYQNRTLEPIISAIIDSMKWKFLTKRARTEGQSIVFFKDPFKLVPVNQIADIADKFTRNEIMTSNEIRSIMGYKPVDDPHADELRNANMPHEDDEAPPQQAQEEPPDEEGAQ